MITATRLSRDYDETSVPPVRIVHIGLGAFHRAHQAWYTAHAPDADEWGIAAFTGRARDAAERLAPQDGLYTLIERGPERDDHEVVSSIVAVRAGDDVDDLIRMLAHPRVAVLTLTITEAGYRAGVDGTPNPDDPEVVSDLAELRLQLGQDPAPAPHRVRTTLGRVLLGLAARRRAGSPGLAVVPCDNIPDNGAHVRRALTALARATDPALADWLAGGVSFVSTSVDRITPRTTDADRQSVLDHTGLIDAAPVVCEPFSDWVLSGDFPAGRPAWEAAGARFVDDIEPWEARKLWMLNGAHTVLAAFGPMRGHTLVHEAIADPVCLELVQDLWAEDVRHLPAVETTRYARDLLERFRNPRIAHRLDQIAIDAATKVRLRIVPVAVRERAVGGVAGGSAGAIAAWVLAGAQDGIASGEPPAIVRDVVAALDPRLGDDADFCAVVDGALRRLMPLVVPAYGITPDSKENR